MLLRKAIQKTKFFLLKTLQNLKSFLFVGYQKLPKARPVNPLYKDFSAQSDSDNEKVLETKRTTESMEPMNEEDAQIGSFMKLGRKGDLEYREREEKKVESSNEGQRGGAQHQMLTEKMKELEMMDMNDLDHVMDIEEVLHYYSRLRCPVYLEIVDKFFMEMYSEFCLPQPSFSISSSSHKLGTL
ncbi:hypothetical protein NMG60_11005009 [Bertholletia excelsa]